MKIIAVILSIGFLALNFMPCSDSETISSEEKKEVCENHNDHSGTSDLCSPFCQCHCCHIYAINFQFTEFGIFNPEIFKMIFEGFDKNVNNFGTSILHPPQLS